MTPASLSGIRLLDLSRVIAVPFCTMQIWKTPVVARPLLGFGDAKLAAFRDAKVIGGREAS